ncbi:MAG: biotin/lipoyl-binding protein, partial [Vicinamibacteria bacterium]
MKFRRSGLAPGKLRFLILIVLIVLIVLIAAFAAGCGEKGSSESPGQGGGGGRLRAVQVRTAHVTTEDVSYRVAALGSLEAEEIVQVTAEVEGAVTEVRFHEGDRVTRDTVLLLIDPERHRLEVARAEAAHLRAESDLRRAQEELQRRERLANAELLAMDEVTRYRGASESLEAEVAAARAAWDI